MRLGRSSEVVTPISGRMTQSSAVRGAFRTHRWSNSATLSFAHLSGF
jgi:hypothetical protein